MIKSLNVHDKITMNRLALLHRVYDTSEPASSASQGDQKSIKLDRLPPPMILTPFRGEYHSGFRQP
jgi:hypothetical protein